jgi:hypothetical protein
MSGIRTLGKQEFDVRGGFHRDDPKPEDACGIVLNQTERIDGTPADCNRW